MTKENVEVVRSIYEGINRVSPGGLLALPDEARRDLYEQFFDPELEIVQSDKLVFDTRGTFHGYEGFVECTRELVEALAGLRFDVGRVFDAGDLVVVDVAALATGRGSGVPLAPPRFAHFWEMKGGLVRRWAVYPTLDEALEAAGLSE